MICLTDDNHITPLPIKFIDVKQYQLDTWWNKVLIFNKKISGIGKNLYFDLDVNIKSNIDFLVDNIQDDSLYVVDTPWKPEYFKKSRDGKFCYGNSSVMGWKGSSQDYLFDMLINNVFEHTIKHVGDDTFLNYNGKIKYFDRFITSASKQRKYVDLEKIVIHFNSLSNPTVPT